LLILTISGSLIGLLSIYRDWGIERAKSCISKIDWGNKLEYSTVSLMKAGLVVVVEKTL
jgi:hypothetical protein